MKNNENKLSRVPASIQLLFNNKKLDVMKVLCLMNAFSVESKKQRKVGEMLFYYSLVNFNLITLFDKTLGEESKSMSSPNLYFRFQTKIDGILLSMSQLNFIEIRGSISDKIENINLKLLPQGKEFYENNSSDYLNALKEEYLNMFDTVAYSAKNVNKIKGEDL